MTTLLMLTTVFLDCFIACALHVHFCIIACALHIQLSICRTFGATAGAEGGQGMWPHPLLGGRRVAWISETILVPGSGCVCVCVWAYIMEGN